MGPTGGGASRKGTGSAKAETGTSRGGPTDLGVGEVGGGELLLPDDLHGRLAVVIGQPLDEQHAVEVVELVLEAPGRELVGLDRELVAVEVVPHQVHLLRPDQLEGEPRD